MGGHGALISHLKNPGMYKSVSAMAPICNPSQCPWGLKAFEGYLGADRTSWAVRILWLVIADQCDWILVTGFACQLCLHYCSAQLLAHSYLIILSAPVCPGCWV